MKNCGFTFKNTYVSLPACFYTHIAPEPVTAPEMVILNDELASHMGLCFSDMSDTDKAALFAGNSLPAGAEPIAQAYAGHQFGQFTMLGDGRAHLLGEHITLDGKRMDVQFKGSGRTPYSRRGDGRAALGPMLREYVISEAMHWLGIPTTRSLAVVTTGEPVYRESMLQGAILTRVASSHIRIGTFEFAAAQQNKTLVETLLNYTIDRHYPETKEKENKAIALLQAVMERHIDLIVEWLRVGFIHGVMNTDNMALSGETIDYGPCAFMDVYDPATVFSSIDHMGRYAYANQPHIVQWNIARLAETLLPLLHENIQQAAQMAEDVIQSFNATFQQTWLAMMRRKLGLFGKEPEDEKLIAGLLKWMQRHELDYTNTFRTLSPEASPEEEPYDSEEFRHWWQRWQSRIAQNNKSLESSFHLMHTNNPAIIPRNHNVEEALSAAEMDSDFSAFHQLMEALSSPYEDKLERADFQKPPKPDERVYQTFCGT